MKPEDMLYGGNSEKVKELWPTAREELLALAVELEISVARGDFLAFAAALEIGRAGITACRIKMAVLLGDEAFESRLEEAKLSKSDTRLSGKVYVAEMEAKP